MNDSSGISMKITDLSVPKRVASCAEKAVFPLAVGPKITKHLFFIDKQIYELCF